MTRAIRAALNVFIGGMGGLAVASLITGKAVSVSELWFVAGGVLAIFILGLIVEIHALKSRSE